MNFKGLEKLSPVNGERYIIVEDGEPSAVVMSFEDYQDMRGENNAFDIDDMEEMDEFEPEFPLEMDDDSELEPEFPRAFNPELDDEEEKPMPESKMDSDDRLDSDVKLEPESKKELTLEDLPF